MKSGSAVLSELIRHMHASEDDLSPLIDRYLLKRDASPTRLEEYTVPLIPRDRPPGRLSPSHLCECERLAAFKFLGVKGHKKTDPQTELVFDDGNWRHYRWDATFLDMERVLGPTRFKCLSIEKLVTLPDLYTAGTLDAKIKLRTKQFKKTKKLEKAVVDFKGCNRRAFEYVMHQKSPRALHIKQVIAYCVAENIDLGMVLYDNKDDQRYQVFSLRFDADVWQEVQSWCEGVIEKLEARKLPRRAVDCNEGNYHFNRCPFAHLCFSRTKDREQVRRIVYRNFEGVDAAWEEFSAA